MLVGTENILAKHNKVLLSLSDVTTQTTASAPIDIRKIIDYIFNEDFLQMTSFGLSERDIFTNEKIPCCGNVYSDGVFFWSDVLGIYIIRHNIQIPEEFVEHILSQDIVIQKLTFEWEQYAKNPQPVQTIDLDLSIATRYMSLEDALIFITGCNSNQELEQKLKQYGYIN